MIQEPGSEGEDLEPVVEGEVDEPAGQGEGREPEEDPGDAGEGGAEAVEPGVVPEGKLYFKIGEVARIVGVKPYVLRYWETEFSVLKPGKTRSRHRLYRRRDVEILLRIKDLLHTRRFTIEGARKKLREESSTEASRVAPDTGALAEIRDALVKIRDSLN